MVKNKAPREDGVTVEVLKLTWEWMKAPCITFIITVEAAAVGMRLGATLLNTIYSVLSTKAQGNPLAQIIHATLQAIWKDRNKKLFRNRVRKTLITVILGAVKREIEGRMRSTGQAIQWTEIIDEVKLDKSNAYLGERFQTQPEKRGA
ncbi:hypothetical protein R1sor_002580 [Riccia sorocarpa]|uniref:Uncharacterized protein n=1 Tax=Riccia sorocarpa TaxID=122646 RepID=A0ABD3GZ72_9MARC